MKTLSQNMLPTRFLVVLMLFLTAVASIDNKKCYVEPEVVVPDADVQFGLLLSLRAHVSATSDQPVTRCGSILGPALEQYLAAEWLVHRLNAYNNGTGYIPGVKIGFQALDDCGSPLFASGNALTFLDRWSPSFDQCPTSQVTPESNATKDPLPIGFVGASSSDIAMEVATATRAVPLPMISMAATKPELSDKNSYPTFLRTAQSDERQMNAITDMLQQLKWTYIAVIHINDSYGRSVSESLAQQALARGICIQRTLILTSSTFSNDLSSMLQQSLGNSLAVVFIGSSADADDLLYAIEKLGYLDGQEVKFGLRVILASSESSLLDSTVFDNLDTFGEGTLSVGKVTVNMSADLEPDMQRLLKNGKDKNALIEEHAAAASKSDLFKADSPNPLVPVTLHAVMALVEGLKTVHSAFCGRAQGPCQRMVKAVESGQLLTSTLNVKLDYETMDPDMVPAVFIDKKSIVQFDKQGDITQPVYTIHQYRKMNKKYQQVGLYQDGSTVLQPEKMHWLTPAGHTALKTPTSVCDGNCEHACIQAQGRGEMPLAIMPGTDGYIIGLFSIHDTDDKNPFDCGSFRFVANDAIVAEGFFYAVRRLRSMTGLNFGAIGINDCYSPLRSQSILQDLFSNLPSANRKAFPELGNLQLDQVVGVVACRSSGCTIPVAAFFMQLHVNVVSYAASSPDLDDKADFPYFLRTVPSDEEQAKVMLNITKAMGWEFAGLLYVK
ncbi:metabotropic glutamate receptor 5 [Elysia marginata]|uniref:Metabotropic glutamate receptor 5 n=1 Tax=Elysia marginata TaxID=1093978 RepID=A0AAV4GX48_9GAST|nr:metabotropic glutamate receptor 5 [Elysia marginata]